MVKSPPSWNLYSRGGNTRKTNGIDGAYCVGEWSLGGKHRQGLPKAGVGRGNRQHHVGVGQPSWASLTVSTEEG